MAITLGGAGGGSEVNDQKFINSEESLITTSSGQKWLKSGTLSSDTTTYPDATSTFSGATYANTTFNISGQGTDPEGMANDGAGNFWICFNNEAYIRKYNSSFVYQNVQINLGSGADPRGLFYVASSAKTSSVSDGGVAVLYVALSNIGGVKRYNASTGAEMSGYITNAGNVRGVTVDSDNYVWTIESNGNVKKWNASDNTAAANFSTFGTAGTGDIFERDGFLWVISNSHVAHKYAKAGTNLVESFSLNPLSQPGGNFSGVTLTDTHLYYTAQNFAAAGRLLKFNIANAIGLSSSLAEAGSPLYTRIK